MITAPLKAALLLVAFATALGAATWVQTTAVTLGLFGGLGVPCYGLAAALYAVEVVRDLRRHDVL